MIKYDIKHDQVVDQVTCLRVVIISLQRILLTCLCSTVVVESNADELKHWLSLEEDVRSVIEKHWEVDDIVDEDGEHVEFQGDVHEALEL